jgi:general secretion pathway protein J
VVPPNPNAANLPDGVRLVLVLPPGQAISGKLTRDWIRPNFGGNKS